MKWMDRLTGCIAYIEENLSGNIDYDTLARRACLSRLYFFRMFEAVTDISVSAYIRKRRMSLAVRRLREDRDRIIDIAMDFGYSSSEAFSRAFKQVHGISPSQARAESQKLKSYPPIAIKITLKGEAQMEYTIESKPALKLIGASITTCSEDGRNNEEIPQFWNDIHADGTFARLCAAAANNDACYGICYDYNAADSSFKYAAAVDYAGGDTDGFEEIDIPAAKWAVFPCTGPMPGALQSVWKRIFSEWLPATGNEIADGAQIEFYYPGDTSSDDYRSEVWIPIK